MGGGGGFACILYKIKLSFSNITKNTSLYFFSYRYYIHRTFSFSFPLSFSYLSNIFFFPPLYFYDDFFSSFLSPNYQTLFSFYWSLFSIGFLDIATGWSPFAREIITVSSNLEMSPPTWERETDRDMERQTDSVVFCYYWSDLGSTLPGR